MGPGAGGWPTIKYFNKETGLDGGTYVKVTDKAMCEELGDEELMTNYVEEYGNTMQCNPVNLVGCTDRDKTYIGVMGTRSTADLEDQFRRLTSYDPKTMKKHVGDWIIKRKKILKVLIANRPAENTEL